MTIKLTPNICLKPSLGTLLGGDARLPGTQGPVFHRYPLSESAGAGLKAWPSRGRVSPKGTDKRGQGLVALDFPCRSAKIPSPDHRPLRCSQGSIHQLCTLNYSFATEQMQWYRCSHSFANAWRQISVSLLLGVCHLQQV